MNRKTYNAPKSCAELVRNFIDAQDGCPKELKLKLDRHLTKKGIELGLLGLQQYMIDKGMISKI